MENLSKEKKIYRTIQIDSNEALDILSVHAITKEKMTLKRYLEKLVRDKVLTLKKKS